MRVDICTTTINSPTEALRKFHDYARRNGGIVHVAGDAITPEAEYRDLEDEHLRYYSLPEQHQMDPELSTLVGPRCIQRRNFAMLAAFRDGADVLALVDDDNVPLPGWGNKLSVGHPTETLTIPADNPWAFDPLTVHRCEYTPMGQALHHRGYPVQLNRVEACTELMVPLVQADLWYGEPDVDALCRIAAGGELNVTEYPGGNKFFRGQIPGPYNSQNTFLHHSVIQEYFLFPALGRMDDIWASYLQQYLVPDSVVYGPASVRQDRNPHDLSKDLADEMIGYRHTLDLIKWLRSEPDLDCDAWPEWFPTRAHDAWTVWREITQ